MAHQSNTTQEKYNKQPGEVKDVSIDSAQRVFNAVTEVLAEPEGVPIA